MGKKSRKWKMRGRVREKFVFLRKIILYEEDGGFLLDIFKRDPIRKFELKLKLIDLKICFFYELYRIDIVRIEVAPELIYNRKS